MSAWLAGSVLCVGRTEAQGTVETQKGPPPAPAPSTPQSAPPPAGAPERPAIEPAPGKPALAPKPVTVNNAASRLRAASTSWACGPLCSPA